MTMERKTITIDEAAARLGISRNSAYFAAHRGEIPIIKIGKRMLVVLDQFSAMLGEKLKSESPAAANIEPPAAPALLAQPTRQQKFAVKPVYCGLRFDLKLHARLVELAASEHRSLNSEICGRLERSLLDDRLAKIETLLLKVLDAVQR